MIKKWNNKTCNLRGNAAASSTSFESEDFTGSVIQRWSLVGAWLCEVMGANQFVFLLVFRVRKPWFHPVAFCCGVLLPTPAPELLCEVEGSTPTLWVPTRLPGSVLWLVDWFYISLTLSSPLPPRTGLWGDGDSPTCSLLSTQLPAHPWSRSWSRVCPDLLWLL